MTYRTEYVWGCDGSHCKAEATMQKNARPTEWSTVTINYGERLRILHLCGVCTRGALVLGEGKDFEHGHAVPDGDMKK